MPHARRALVDILRSSRTRWGAPPPRRSADGDPGAGARQPRDAGRRVVRRTPRSTTPSTSSRGKDDAETAILHASELRELGELTWGELRAPGRRGRRRPARARGRAAATASSPTCRTSPRRSSPSSPPPRSARSGRAARPTSAPASVVDRFAQIEPKVLFAVDGYRYGGKDFDRREVVAELQAAMPSLEHTVVLPYLDPDPDLSASTRRDALGRAAAAGEGAELSLRARPLRPPALGPLLLRHHRPAEGDRPGPGRDPARAPEEAPPPRRRPPRRPPLLVHDDRLDDVELPRLRAADRGRDRPLRRQPRPPRHGRALGPGRARRDHDVRHQRRLHRRLHEGRRRARRRAATSAASARSARPAPRSPPRASTGSTSTSAPTPGCSRPAAAPTSAPPSSAASPLLPVYRGELQARALGAAVEAWDEDGNSRHRRGRRARRHRADALDARLLLGRRRRHPLPRQLLRACTPASGATATGSRSPRAARRSSTAAPTRRSTAAAIRMGTSEIYRAVLGLDEIVDALVVDVPREGTDGWMPLFVVLREGAELDDELPRRDRPPDPRAAARPATSPTRSSRSPRSRAPSAARCSRSR